MADSYFWHRALELFVEVVDRPPEERAALLAEACGDDAELRAEVESLLEHDRQVSEDFLRPPEPPPGIRPPDPPDGPDPLIGAQVGKYQIKSLIAAGGMGSVYEAVQQEPRRIVALKVMKRNVASRSALRRFQFEAQVLARLRHPNIAQVYEAGMHRDVAAGPRTGRGEQDREGILGPAEVAAGAPPAVAARDTADTAVPPSVDPNRDRERAAIRSEQNRDRERAGISSEPSRDREGAEYEPSRDREGAVIPGGVPYFAMEYIPDAKTITQYGEEKNLGPRDRLRLFVKACDAVQHGHQKGIIHRDLKPPNILVDSTGEPKVIDFGVARATDSDVAVTTMQTDVGQLIGTMQYMSPEQCDADPHELDTRSDVYSLGVVLYELLTGALPYEAAGSTIYQATKAIKEEPPRSLSSINPKLRGDVDTIVLKALEKDREQRYQSAADLAQDIRRHLNGELIEAKLPTAWTRAVHWAARNPVVTTAAACVTIGAIIIAATITSVWLTNSRPYRVRLTDDRREVWLQAFSGRILHTWGTETAAGISFAKLVERADELGGGQVAVIGFSNAQGIPHPNALCAYDAGGDLEAPVWVKSVETPDLPPSIPEDDLARRQFDVSFCKVFDVFPDPPGPEIVAVHANAYSQRAIRVYSLDGEILYQVWHEGSLNDCHWVSDAELLVFSGDDGRGHVGKLGYVVFAVRPQRDVRERDYLHTRPGGEPRGPLTPVWYRWLLPVEEAAKTNGFAELGPPIGEDAGLFVRLVLLADAEAHATVTWNVDRYGSIVGVPVPNDPYRQRQSPADGDPANLPDPEIFKLGPMPAVERPSDHAEQPADKESDTP